MSRPTLTINGKTIELPNIKVKAWREIAKANEEIQANTFLDAGFMERHCKFIALAFDVPIEEILDNLCIDDVLPLYSEVASAVTAMITAKLGDKKNVADEPAESINPAGITG